MKTNFFIIIIISILLLFISVNASAAITVTLTKGTNVPDNVCNNTTYEYLATFSGLVSGTTYSVEWTPSTTGALDGTFSFNNTTSTAHIKWNATTAVNTGTLIVKIYTGTDSQKVKVGESNALSVVIKSIKHLTATFIGIPSGSPWSLSPCEAGTLNLEAGNMNVPGTGDINPERVTSFAWLVPKGWTVNGWTSPDGATWKITSPNVTVTYPKSNIGGSVKVKASYLTACGDVQESLESSAITVNRTVAFSLSTDKSYMLCGDNSPVTFTVTPALSCAIYYWNNSPTGTTSNSYEVTTNGSSDITAIVNVLYGTSSNVLTKTLKYTLFAPGVTPKIVGSNILCTGNYDYSVSDLRPGYSVAWTLDAKIQQVNVTGNVITVKSTSSGNATINATISSNCGTYSSVPAKTVWIGRPGFPSSVSGPSQLTPGLSAVYSITPATGALSYSWQIPTGCYSSYCWHITSGQGTSAISVQAGAIGSGAIQCSASNGCGEDSRYMYINVQDPNAPCDPPILSISPNPSVGGDVVIDVIKPPCDPTLLSGEPATLSVIDNMGTVVYSKKHSGNKVAISGLHLIQGLYHVVYIQNNKRFEKSMIVQ
jgi:PKD-like domain